MNDLSNREFGDDHIIRRIGSGATAEVFLAEQRSLGRRVALKILKKDLASDETYLRRFVREAKAIAALNHSGLVQIYQTDCLDGYWFIAQEYVQGETLHHEIQRSGTVAIPVVVDILWQVAAALETAAESGIVHRDIKPENILLGQNGVAKVTDFGLAHIKISTERSQLALTEAGMTLGTPLYMSPEQAQGHKLDHRSDIYSLGITCWHALVGKPPFMGGTALSVALQHVNTAPPPLLKQRHDIPPALASIIERMIEKKPENRFQTFHCILEELQANGLTPDKPMLASRARRSQRSTRQMLQRALKQRRTFFGGIVSLCLFAVIFSLLGWLSGHAARTWRERTWEASMKEIAERIPKKPTIEEQWIYACFLNTPDAWQALLDHFPDEEYFWGNKAKRQQMRYYYYEEDIVNSLPLFGEFAYLSNLDSEDQALGFAGLAWCAIARRQPDSRTAQNWLNQIQWHHILNAEGLFRQIFYDTNERIHHEIREQNAEQ
jgi:serine/threonine-protein kinase